MQKPTVTRREKLILAVGAFFFVTTLWYGWLYSTLKIRTKFAEEQIRIFSEMSNRSMASTPADAAGCLDYVVNYYPSGSKQTRGSALDTLVEAQRKRAQLEIISVLRARTRDDLGQEPGPWIKKYGKIGQPIVPK